VLASLTDDDVSNEAFRFLDIRHLDLAMTDTLVGRITFTGDLGFEFWVPASLQVRLFDLLMEAGETHGIRPFGLRALDSMRFDKDFGAWSTEYRPIYTPDEAGMGRFVKPDKGEFIGRDEVLVEREQGPQRRLCAFTLDDALAIDVLGDEPIWHGGEVVGWVTSGGYAHWSRASCALGYVPVAIADATDFEIEVLGVRRRATRRNDPMFDHTGSRMRG
jgi:dimethylglycine dehydrogenase